MKDNHKQN